MESEFNTYKHKQTNKESLFIAKPKESRHLGNTSLRSLESF